MSNLQKEVERLRKALKDAAYDMARIHESSWDENQMRLCAEASEGRIRMALKREAPPSSQAQDKEPREPEAKESGTCNHEWRFTSYVDGVPVHQACRKCPAMMDLDEPTRKSPPSAPKESEVEPHRKLEIAAKMVIAHWHEFGPEHSFEETMHWLEVAWKECQKLGRKA